MVAAYEAGKRSIQTMAQMRIVADFLGLTVDEILHRVEIEMKAQGN